MLNTPFSSWPAFDAEEAQAVSEVLLSNRVNYWTGDQCRQFEDQFAARTHCEYAIALANGTLALDLALRALDVGIGDEVVVTPRTFMASVSSVALVGATPVFADVCPDSQNITAASIEAVITKRTKAIIVVHLAGWVADMDPIMELASKNDIKVIEDCAQAHGGFYRDKSVGSIGNIGIWSFCQDKIMTTAGEGGMVTTNDKELWNRMWSFKDHGKDYDLIQQTNVKPGFRWLHTSFGSNYRMLEMQAAVGLLQLLKLDEWSARRLDNATRIWSAAQKCSALRVPVVPQDIVHAAYKCYVFVRPEQLKSDWSRDRIVAEILAQGVPVYTGSCSEVYLEQAFEGTGFRPKSPLPCARQLGETSLMFLVHPTLTQSEIEKTCTIMEQVVNRASL